MNEIQKTIILMLVALTWSSLAAAELPYGRSCDARIPFDIPLDRSMAEVSRLHFIAKFPRSYADFLFTNRSSKPVVSLLAVVELRDQQGQYMFNMLFHAYEFKAYRRDTSPSSPEYQTKVVTQFDQPVMPGAKETWSMSSSSFVTDCPASAHASIVQIQFGDGTVLAHSAADARRQPVVIDASSMDFSQAPFSPPFEVLATLEIDVLGRPSVTNVGFASDDFVRWVGARVEKWEFAPAYSGVTAVPGKLQILFRFHKGTPPPSPVIAKLPNALVFEVADIFPPKPGRRLAKVYLGGVTISIRGTPDE
jgi:hypothetical protein